MSREKDVSIPLILSILQEPDARRARESYLRILNVEDFDDQTVHDHLEDLVCNALMLDQTTVELNPELALVVLLMLKAGIKKQCGGQRKSRHEEMRKRTLARLGRGIKSKHVAKGESAIQAHLIAAKVVARYGRLRGLKIAENTIAREMDNAS